MSESKDIPMSESKDIPMSGNKDISLDRYKMFHYLEPKCATSKSKLIFRENIFAKFRINQGNFLLFLLSITKDVPSYVYNLNMFYYSLHIIPFFFLLT